MLASFSARLSISYLSPSRFSSPMSSFPIRSPILSRPSIADCICCVMQELRGKVSPISPVASLRVSWSSMIFFSRRSTLLAPSTASISQWLLITLLAALSISLRSAFALCSRLELFQRCHATRRRVQHQRSAPVRAPTTSSVTSSSFIVSLLSLVSRRSLVPVTLCAFDSRRARRVLDGGFSADPLLWP